MDWQAAAHISLFNFFINISEEMDYEKFIQARAYIVRSDHLHDYSWWLFVSGCHSGSWRSSRWDHAFII
jgi:hypothetical protein